MLTLNDYLLSCGGGGSGGGGSGGGRVSDGGGGVSGGRVSSGDGSSCGWLWLLFIVVDILFYCSRFIILLWCLYYFIVLKVKIDSLLLDVL